jgi:glucose/arabinose dehydrogenase
VKARWIVLALTILWLTACGRSRPPAETAAPPPAVTPTPLPTPPPVSLRAENLLDEPGAVVACDAGGGASITCRRDDAVAIEVAVNASNFARWSMKFAAPDAPLAAGDVLYLRAGAPSELSPNLYLVEADGDRVAVPLRRRGMTDSVGDVLIPLAEFADDDGNRIDPAQVVELQIVFEWADMAGTMTVERIQFVPVWEEPVAVGDTARELATALTVPDGFAAGALVDDLSTMTQIDFTPEGDMLVSVQNGRVWWYTDDTGDGVYDRRRLYFSGLAEIVGLLYDPVDGGVWLGGRGQLYRTLDSDGDGAADVQELRVDGLPWGRHQNNGLAWNPVPDPFTGEDAPQWIYFGLGSTGDLEDGGPINSTVLRFPRDGTGADALEVVSRGNRNPYSVTWAPVPVDLADPDGPTAWQLFASENGPDFNDAPDEVNHIRWAHHYGFPVQFGPVDAPAADGEPYSGPVYPATAHASASGLAYVSNPAWPAEFRTLYVSLFGQVFSPDVVGHIVEGVTLRTEEVRGGVTYRGEPFDFITGLDRPLPMAVAPDGNLVVGDYATGVIYHVGYVGAD